VPTNEHAVHSLSVIQARQEIHIADLRNSLDCIHKRCIEVAAGRRSKARQRQHGQHGVAVPNFDLGYFVLVAQRDTKSINKVSLHWRGPRRITRVLSDHVYEVDGIESWHATDVHSSHLRFYHDASLDVTAALVDQIAHNDLGYDVRAITDIRFDAESKEYQILLSWLGFDRDDDSWEPLAVLLEDVPDKVHAFFRHSEKKNVIAEARTSLRLLSV
jgi:Chromo (CHRromatin Organisation MOdifier) domain